jgi:hypothetical protein
MHLPEGEWPDPYARATTLVKLNMTHYGIKQPNREYYEEVFNFIVDNLNPQTSIAAPAHFFGGNPEAKGVLIPVYFANISIVGISVLVASSASRLYDPFKAAGHVPEPDRVQYLGMTVTRDRRKKTISIDRIRYIIRDFDCSGMTDLGKHSTPMAIGYKTHVIHPGLGEEPFDARTYQKAFCSMVYAALC